MDNRRDAVLEHARQRGAFTPVDEARAVAARDEYRRFGADLHVADVLASAGKIPAEEMEAASRGEEIPSRIANLDVVRLAGGTPEQPVLLARRAIDGETFLVHACMRSRGEAPAEVDAFVRAMEDGRRLTGAAWVPVREAGGADGAYAAVSAIPEGMRLEERLATRGPLGPSEAVRLLKRLGEALWPLEALGRTAVFPDPRLVLLDAEGRPCLDAMEVLLASRSGGFDASELARSAASFLARLVGPERLHDPAVRDLMADLSSGRLEHLRPESALRASSSEGDGLETIDLSDAPATPTFTAPLPSSVTIPRAPPRASVASGASSLAASNVPAWVYAAGLLALGAIAFGVLHRGEEAREAKPGRPVAEGPLPEAPEPRPAAPSRPGAPSTGKDPALGALEEALGFLAQHRDDDPQGVLDRLRSVEARYGGTEAAIRASGEREQFLRDTEAKAEREAQAISNDIDRLLASEELGAAYAALDRFPKRLAFTRASMRMDVLRDRVKGKVESVYATLRPRLEAASDPAREDDARAALERVKALGVPELTQRAEQRLRDALDRAAGKASQRKRLEPALDAAVGDALAAAGAGDADRARQAMDALARGPIGDALPERARASREAVDRVVRAYEGAAGEWRARAGKTASITMREYGAKAFSVTPGEVSADRVAWTRGGVAGGARLGAIDPDSIALLALSSGHDQDGGWVLAVATLFAATGRLPEADAAAARAQSLGASAPSFARETAAVRAHLGALAAREVAAADALAQRDRDAARAAYARAAMTAPFWSGPHRRLAEALATDRRPEEALAEWRRAEALGDASPDVLHGIAKASAAAGRPEEETLIAWRAFLGAAPVGDARLEAARADADRLATRVVRGSTLDRVKAAKALLDAGKATEAVAALEEAVRIDPASLEAQRALARAAEKADDPLRAYLAWREARDASKTAKDAADAKEQLDRLERLHGERPVEATVRAGAAEAAAKGEYATAVEGYRRAISMSSLDVEARLGLGAALLGLGLRTNTKAKLEESQAAYDLAVRVSPEDARGWAGRAEVRRTRGDPAGAIADATEAVRRKKDLFQAYNTRALAQYQSLQYEAAIADLGVVTTLAPMMATPRITRAGVYAVLSRYDEAEADLRAALERNPTPEERAQVTALTEQIAARRKADKPR